MVILYPVKEYELLCMYVETFASYISASLSSGIFLYLVIKLEQAVSM